MSLLRWLAREKSLTLDKRWIVSSIKRRSTSLSLFLWERAFGTACARGRRNGKGIICVAEKGSVTVGARVVNINDQMHGYNV